MDTLFEIAFCFIFAGMGVIYTWGILTLLLEQKNMNALFRSLDEE